MDLVLVIANPGARVVSSVTRSTLRGSGVQAAKATIARIDRRATQPGLNSRAAPPP